MCRDTSGPHESGAPSRTRRPVGGALDSSGGGDRLGDDVRVGHVVSGGPASRSGRGVVPGARARRQVHRVDAAADPSAVFDALVAEGVDRVLTSGGAARSIDGVEALAAFAARSGNVEVMAGGGVQPADIPALFAAGVDAVHLSARSRAGHDAPSGPGGGSAGHDVTDADIVAEAVAAAG